MVTNPTEAGGDRSVNADSRTTQTERNLPLPTLSRLQDTGRTVSPDQEDLRGRLVKDPTGRAVGRIEHLLIDHAEGKVRFLEIASGGLLHLGEAKSFVPVEAIERITEDEVVISPTLERVAAAATYDPDLVVSDARYFFDLYPYFGYEHAEWVAPWISSWPGTKRWNGPR